MDRQRWRTALISPARDLDGRPTQVITGVMDWRGRAHVAMRIGEEGTPVILAEQATHELIANLHSSLNERTER